MKMKGCPSSPLKRIVFRFHETILSFGDWIPRDQVAKDKVPQTEQDSIYHLLNRPKWTTIVSIGWFNKHNVLILRAYHHPKKSPTGPTERTPKPEYLIAPKLTLPQNLPTQIHIVLVRWVWPPHSSSDHQNYYIFNREFR